MANSIIQYDLKMFTALGTYCICNDSLKLLHYNIKLDAYNIKRKPLKYFSMFWKVHNENRLLGDFLRYTVRYTVLNNHTKK